MTETDATRRPLHMPEKFLPYLEKYRIYRMFKDMLDDLILALPRDHLKHMKVFLSQHKHSTRDTDRVMVLVSPELNIDVKRLVKELIKDIGMFVVTRRFIMDRYENHDDYVPGCISPALMSEVTKTLTLKEPVHTAGWLMFDHPCTVREARCLQQDGVLPTVTLVLMPPPPVAPVPDNTSTPARGFFQQDFEGLKYVYRATLKEVHIDPDDDIVKISSKCFNGIRACAGGAQGPGQGHQVVGAPGVYRVLLIGPRGSGRKTQARMLARHFGLVYIDFTELYHIARERNDDAGEKLRNYGISLQLKAEIVRRRIMEKDCIDHGWVMTGYPATGNDFENIDNMETPPNRVIILNSDWATCKQRALNVAVDWCTGKRVPAGSGPRALLHPGETAQQIDVELDNFFTEAAAELRAAAGITAVEINTQEDTIEEIQVKVQAAVIAAPAYDIVSCQQLRNVRGD
ncbi:adenylate kinase 8 [Pectinophora gossypiella]|uniref:adenylate kinase 8 n=1 Tax=Pectinophora gossypiella TaxID=13191 RepID=UPI00214E4209|nr:adenylate kinase 8 [Pectinophora gossypiella]